MSRELLKRALEVIDQAEIYAENEDKAFALCQAIEAELSKPEPEPVAWIDKVNFEKLSDKNWNLTCYVSNTSTSTKNIPLYAAPPERKPIGYIPQHSAAIIKREGLWDACTLYRTKVNPTDVEVFL